MKTSASLHKKSLPRKPLRKMAIAVGLTCICSLATTALYAQTQTGSVLLVDKAPQIVVISGTRYEQFIENLPLSIEVIEQKELERLGIVDIRDLAKNLSNIEVKRAPARFTVTGVGNATGRDGNAGFSIRGQDGNRVLMLIDGMRLPRSYINGSNAFGRDSIAMNLVRQVEITGIIGRL